ncbi:hypothetical protein MLD38_029149 [Melastoma candidum]|uniref:Uncharacterized protein n=1 Tax=Melastoma candidum TaxID=119954 RepID=A0ACB9N392_9MYRT|nr:hypothetical protein MLD38_029149 [Melastoma candidum]
MQSMSTPTTLVCAARLQPRIIPCDFHLRNQTLQNLSPRTDSWRISATSKGFSGVRKKEIEPLRREEDIGVEGGGERDEIPQEVLERMLVRIAVAVFAPAAAGIGLMHVFGVVKQSGIWDVPVWVVVPTTFACLAASALGVAYGGLSTSWDPNRTGSLLGLEEAQKNWADLWQNDPNDP